MAIGVITQMPGMTADQYETLHRQLAPDNQPGPGLLYHAAGPSESGWYVVEVWESQEAVERFFAEHGPLFQQANVTAQPTFFQVVNTMQR